jgi:hypothetical protein
MNAPGTAFEVSYEQPSCGIASAWAKVPIEPSPSQREQLKNEWTIVSKKKKENLCLCGHIIHHYAYVYNVKNGRILKIGVGCCKKYGITT